MENTTYVNYNGLFKSSSSVRCASCKHEFNFQSYVSGFCPACYG
ncbi:zinc finger domain-containing protein, LSD1 subclass [Pseudobutyrivibrio sp. ACV-2]|nr:zinc finger domain-containing protein, LSD1 subclass [Pseudobutyrivibrio sp. ACV-2]